MARRTLAPRPSASSTAPSGRGHEQFWARGSPSEGRWDEPRAGLRSARVRRARSAKTPEKRALAETSRSRLGIACGALGLGLADTTRTARRPTKADPGGGGGSGRRTARSRTPAPHQPPPGITPGTHTPRLTDQTNRPDVARRFTLPHGAAVDSVIRRNLRLEALMTGAQYQPSHSHTLAATQDDGQKLIY